MTLHELERGMELHEKRMARIESGMELHEKRMVRIESHLESHAERFKRIEDNLVVQGELLNRVDQRLDRLAQMFVQSEGERAEDRERLRIMQTAMTSLFERMDAFIQGLERRNGHEKSGSG